jgi:hypothetical protein
MTSATEHDDVVKAVIHPSIGIGRVGNSPFEYFIGPEVPDAPPPPPGFYRDGAGALKRQAARFRVYGGRLPPIQLPTVATEAPRPPRQAIAGLRSD